MVFIMSNTVSETALINLNVFSSKKQMLKPRKLVNNRTKRRLALNEEKSNREGREESCRTSRDQRTKRNEGALKGNSR